MNTLLFFQAAWCGPCQEMKKIIDPLVVELANDVQVTNIDIDANPAYRQQWHIQSIPTFVVIKNGIEVARRIGSGTEQELHELCLV